MLLLLFKFKRRKKEEISFQLLVYGFQLRYKMTDGFPRARECQNRQARRLSCGWDGLDESNSYLTPTLILPPQGGGDVEV